MPITCKQPLATMPLRLNAEHQVLANNNSAQMHVTVIIPAKDEALAIGAVISALQALTLSGQPLIDHIIVVDNASSDNTAAIASDSGATVIFEACPGYGSACMAGIRTIGTTDRVLFVDGDHSCNYADIPALLVAMDEGADLVIGSRSLGFIEPRAMTLPQRWGTALICRLIQYRTGIAITDLGPLRIIRYDKLLELDMRDRRFGWTAEMQVKAYCKGWHVIEVPTTLRARVGQSKISGTWRGTILAAYDLLRAVLFSA